MNLEMELKAATESMQQRTRPEMLAIMATATAKLAASGLAAQALQPGQRMSDFELLNATGRLIRSVDLHAQAALLISFYRGNWCPYCNLELKALQERLKEITALGATLVAISPETPDQSLTTQQKHELKFPVLFDQGNKVARQFGLIFQLDESLQPIYNAFGINLETHNGDRSFELPVPATYLVTQDGTVTEAFINVDHRERLTPKQAISWLQQLSARK